MKRWLSYKTPLTYTSDTCPAVPWNSNDALPIQKNYIRKIAAKRKEIFILYLDCYLFALVTVVMSSKK